MLLRRINPNTIFLFSVLLLAAYFPFLTCFKIYHLARLSLSNHLQAARGLKTPAREVPSVYRFAKNEILSSISGEVPSEDPLASFAAICGSAQRLS